MSSEGIWSKVGLQCSQVTLPLELSVHDGCSIGVIAVVDGPLNKGAASACDWFECHYVLTAGAIDTVVPRQQLKTKAMFQVRKLHQLNFPVRAIDKVELVNRADLTPGGPSALVQNCWQCAHLCGAISVDQFTSRNHIAEPKVEIPED